MHRLYLSKNLNPALADPLREKFLNTGTVSRVDAPFLNVIKLRLPNGTLIPDTTTFVAPLNPRLDTLPVFVEFPELRVFWRTEGLTGNWLSYVPDERSPFDGASAGFFKRFHSVMRSLEINYEIDFNDGANEWYIATNSAAASESTITDDASYPTWCAVEIFQNLYEQGRFGDLSKEFGEFETIEV